MIKIPPQGLLGIFPHSMSWAVELHNHCLFLPQTSSVLGLLAEDATMASTFKDQEGRAGLGSWPMVVLLEEATTGRYP